jgi:hypothetical protein
MAIGVFGLQVAYRLKRLEVMSTTNTHGWFGGGRAGIPTLSAVDRIDFSNDTGTANIRSPLSSTKQLLAATGNSNYGWWGGGSASISSLDRIDFSNDSSTISPRGALNTTRTNLAATGNSNYGWFGGGADGGTIPTSKVERIDFSNDAVTTSPRSPLSLTRINLAATGNSNYGWFGGGSIPTPAVYSTIDRIDFSNDAVTISPRSPLMLGKNSLAATGNSNYGWFCGGATPTAVSTVERVDFSNDLATTSIRGSLNAPAGRFILSATGNSNYGWFGGGYIPGPSPLSIVDRIDFSNDSVTASPRGPLSLARQASGATSGQAKGPAIKLQKAGNFGWFGGGELPAGSSTNIVNRIDFSNDSSTASVRGSLSLARGFLAATGNSNYGWFGGGFPAAQSTVDRIDFSNDSGTTSIRGSLSAARYSSAATGNSNYGWFGAGRAGTPFVNSGTVDRINFSNDSVSASPRGPLSFARVQLAATGNSNFGWFGGGNSNSVQRIDFSNDSSTSSFRGSLVATRYRLAATGNSNYGWFGGGGPAPGSPPVVTVERIDFSNDSVSASPRGPLTIARNGLAATGNSNYGWFSGGGNLVLPAQYSTVDRINFSNDSVSSSVRGSITPATGTQLLAATSNTPT